MGTSKINDDILFVRLERRDADTTLIAVTGEVDSANSDALRRQIVDLVPGPRAGTVALDLGELVFLGSAGVRTLLDCRDITTGRGGRLEITRAHDNVRQVLTICNLTDLFHLPVAATVEDAPHRFRLPWHEPRPS